MSRPPATDETGAVVILGGGIAGIAAALELLEAGRRVTLVEARQFLGGRAFSFNDAAGRPVDNGQHVIVGCCVQFLRFLERLGTREEWHLQPRLRLPVQNRRGKAGFLTASRLPAPLHLLPSFLAYPHLRGGDKLRVLAGMLRASLVKRHRPRLEQITFYQWLKENGQSERAIQNLWNLVVEPTLNDNVRDVSAAMGLMIVQEGMLQGRHNANLGYARKGLLQAIGEPARRRLEELGARLVFGNPARRLLLQEGRVCGVELASGERVAGGEYLSALPFNALLRILPPEVAGLDFFRNIGGLEWSPIVNVHIRYDRPALEEDFCALVDSPLQWVFNKGRILDDGSDAPGQYVTISVSAAWEYVGLSREELTRRFIEEMAQVFPAAREAVVEGVTVVKQREATFRCRPGAARLRPGPATPVPNLYLAGEWTDTGWPSTMEGAVRSGYQAAGAIALNRQESERAAGD